VLDTPIRKETQTTQIRHEPSYKQLDAIYNVTLHPYETITYNAKIQQVAKSMKIPHSEMSDV